MVKDWITDWFETNANIDRGTINSNLDNNYFEAGFIDSLAFINFLADIEKKFNITFSNDEFQNRDFSTINGLAKIIESKINE